MKQFPGNGLILGVAACVVLTARPAWATATQITAVQVNKVNGGISVVLKTSTGDHPQVFTTKIGKSLVADIINTQLHLANGQGFRQDNPAPGITSVEVKQLDPNSIRVIVTGDSNIPNSQPVARQQDSITFNFTSVGSSTTSASTTPTQSGKKPEVLVPNPKVSIDGVPASSTGPGQPYNQAPPFLPRAVAPPVGDIAEASIDTSLGKIDLGTDERVPRLVLRDAPVREVLSLLARAAGLNLAYSENGQPENQQSARPENGGTTISLDVQNEPVQDVFNNVLRLSNLEANRVGRTIFVGPKLPNTVRDIALRNIRLNQVKVADALNFLVGLGAESAIAHEQQVTSVSAVPVGNSIASPITQTETTTETVPRVLRVDFKDSTPLLRGLEVLGDERTNSVTLFGPPKLIDVAVAQLTQLDIRRRQVVVNVKVIDINLSNTQEFGTSFSFALGSNYFANDGGAATLNFGGSNPATGAEVTSNIAGGSVTPVIANPYASATPLLSPTQLTTINGVGTTIINESATSQTILGTTVAPGGVVTIPGTGYTNQPISPASTNPLQPGFSTITQPTNNIITINADGTTSVTQGTNGTATAALPSLYQFPKKLLSTIQAQITSGSAKILTDPTLIVQEGQQALVQLTQEVVGNVSNQINSSNNLTTQTVSVEKVNVGLSLNVKIDRVDDNGFVSLSVSPTVTAPQASQIINLQGGSSQTISLVSTRSLQTGLIRLRDGQTLILSGIIQDQDTSTVTKIPILGDIPLLGALFRQTNRSNQRKEVVVLLTPQIMDDTQDSAYGYNYSPSPEVRNILEHEGLKLPGKQQ